MVGTATLPHVDEHWIDVAASPEQVWLAIERAMVEAMGDTPWKRLYSAAVGAAHRTATGAGLAPGRTFVGFAVTAADPPRQVRLEGEHRFARYALSFRIQPTASGARVGAFTDAGFPGAAGSVYRALVIGSGAHALVMGGLLRRIGRLAEAGHGPTRR
jgi:hypothetical protein